MQKHIEVKGAGHYGIFSGKRWREAVYPEVKAFIAAYHNLEVPAAGLPGTVKARKSEAVRTGTTASRSRGSAAKAPARKRAAATQGRSRA
jgi:poly(3-hydroxybutyrate) depolymerase